MVNYINFNLITGTAATGTAASGTGATGSTRSGTTDSVNRLTSTADWLARRQQAHQYPRLKNSLANSLQNKLISFKKSLDQFAWPNNANPFSKARLAVYSNGLEDKINADIPAKEDVRRYEKYYSRGFTQYLPANLAPGEYELDLSLGSETDTVEVAVTSGMTNREVLEAVVESVNNSTLAVQARAFFQSAPGLQVKGLSKTGSILELSVNQGYPDQDLKISASGQSVHLKNFLDLEATEVPQEPATEQVYSLTATSLARPTAITTRAYDPNQATTLAPGDYSLTLSMGNMTETLNISISSGETWGDVLDDLAFTIGSSTLATAETVDAKRPSGLDSDNPDLQMADGTSLSIQAKNPKLGQRLYISGGEISGGGTDNIVETMGLAKSAYPGSDGRMTVNQEEQIRAPGYFTQDQGRLVIEPESTFGRALPLKVVDALTRLEDNLSDIVAGYNGLKDFFNSNEPYLKSQVAEELAGPIEDNKTDLEWMGMTTTSKGLVSFDHDRFYQALGQDPDKVGELLQGEGGLVTEWMKSVNKMLGQGADSYLSAPSAQENRLLPDPEPVTELELDMGRQLVDMLDTLPRVDDGKDDENKEDEQDRNFFSASGGIVDQKG